MVKIVSFVGGPYPLDAYCWDPPEDEEVVEAAPERPRKPKRVQPKRPLKSARKVRGGVSLLSRKGTADGQA